MPKYETPVPRPQYLAERARNITSSAVMYFDGAGRILMIRNAMSGNWQLPGGGRDQGESPWQAVQREVREEIGWDITDEKPRLLAVGWVPVERTDDPDDTEDCQILFRLQVPDPMPAIVLSGEHTEAKLLTVDQWQKELSPRKAARLRMLSDADGAGDTVYLDGQTVQCF
jgi:8-oxo-dGTP diphosphatase